MDFFDKTGKMAIGSRLRLLTDRLTADAADIYRLYGNDFKPKWFPGFLCAGGWRGKDRHVHCPRNRTFTPLGKQHSEGYESPRTDSRQYGAFRRQVQSRAPFRERYRDGGFH